MADSSKLQNLSKLVRYFVLEATTQANSGHPTSCLSAADIMTALYFTKLRFDLDNVENPNNDRVIFSKGHVSALIYALYAVAGKISEEELLTYRKFGSELEGHPTLRFKYAEAATGSLGQGLSVGVGEALAIKKIFSGPVSDFPPTSAPQSFSSNMDIPKSKLKSKKARVRAGGNPFVTVTRENLPVVYVLMGDSEIAEGSVWEACEIASYYKLGNLVAIVDVNRLGQSRETMVGWKTDIYKERFEAFGWEAYEIDGHDFAEIEKVLAKVGGRGDKPIAIIAKTVKGKGVSFLENKEGWHGKALGNEDFEKAVRELGDFDKLTREGIAKPSSAVSSKSEGSVAGFPPVNVRSDDDRKVNFSTHIDGTPSIGATLPVYKVGEEVATRKAYGEALVQLGVSDKRILSLDGETSNSTFSEIFREKFPKRYFEMFIAEQNMVGVALGMSKRGYVPFVSTFSAFFTRALDQIRMSVYSGANIKFVGSHSGVSIGEDGPSQMGLEDMSMFRSLLGSTVLCPADAVSCAKLVQVASQEEGIFFIRTARPATPVLYREDEDFWVGGSKVLKQSESDVAVIVACGVTVNQALLAHEILKEQKIKVAVVDAYSVKPIDSVGIREAAKNAGGKVITVEDHYAEGGLGDSVLNVFADGSAEVFKLAVTKMPMSGRGEELLEFEGISASGIVAKIKEVIHRK